MKKDTNFFPPAVGGSSLLVIFALLALSVFAVLSISAAKAEARLSDRSAQTVAAWYAADLQAEKEFSRLKNEVTEPGTYAYECPVSENSRVQVRLHFDGSGWKVLQWQTVTEEPQIRETLAVWDGN